MTDLAEPNDVWTEDEVARGFVDEHHERLKFCHTRGKWYIWRGSTWTLDDTREVFEWVRLYVRSLSSASNTKQRSKMEKHTFIANAETIARSDRAVTMRASDWDADPYLLGTPAGTVDLRTGELRPARPEDRITRRVAVAPAEEAACPAWQGFLDDATAGDAGLVRFLRQWCGYCLTGDTKEHALLFLYGPGGNGKSVFVETVSHIIGEYAATASMETFTASNTSQHLTFLAMLAGARLVTASETEEGRAWAETKIKQVTGGDKITANFMRRDPFTFKPQFKLLVAGNHKPALTNVDEAARRRFNIVPFTRKPARPDPDLPHKLRAEAAGILRWCIDGCLDWQDNGLVRPRIVQEATAEYFDAQDVLSQWLEERCRVEPDNRLLLSTASQLFADWSGYATAAGERPGSQKSFGAALAKRGFVSGREYVANGDRRRVWYGIALARTEVAA